MTLIKCFRCDGKGKLRGKADLMLGVFTLGISALRDKSVWYACKACNGRGYLKDTDD